MTFKVTVEDTDSAETITRVQIMTRKGRNDEATIEDVPPGESRTFTGDENTSIKVFEIPATLAVGEQPMKLAMVPATPEPAP